MRLVAGCGVSLVLRLALGQRLGIGLVPGVLECWHQHILVGVSLACGSERAWLLRLWPHRRASRRRPLGSCPAPAAVREEVPHSPYVGHISGIPLILLP